MLELTGSEGNRDPRVQDERITVDAKRIDLTFEGPMLMAKTEVRSVMQPARDAPRRTTRRAAAGRPASAAQPATAPFPAC